MSKNARRDDHSRPDEGKHSRHTFRSDGALPSPERGSDNDLPHAVLKTCSGLEVDEDDWLSTLTAEWTAPDFDREQIQRKSEPPRDSEVLRTLAGGDEASSGCLG